MGPAGKVPQFRKVGNDWFCSSGLPSDITVVMNGVSFHLHKFPLFSRCGKIARMYEELQITQEKTPTIALEECPGGPDTFLIVARFCYGSRVEFTPRNIVTLLCAANYLEMTNEFGEDNLLYKLNSFFHRNVLQSWKDCLLAIKSSEPVFSAPEKLKIVSKCLNALSTMVCTDPSLFGWPMKMYGSLQSPGGSILWNGIKTGARIRSSESDWWFEDISCLSVHLFQKLIKTMVVRGIRPENLAGAIMYYMKKHLPGLGRWTNAEIGKTIVVVVGYNSKPASVDQKGLLETIEKLLPEKKGKSFCRFLLRLLRVGFILGVDRTCIDSLERRIGMQLELATLDTLLIPSYSDSDALYNTDCVERIIQHFLSRESGLMPFSSPLLDLESSPLSEPLTKVARLVDSYIVEVASDVSLKPQRMRYLAEALPESSRPLHDGLYRALDIYFKTHMWLSEEDKDELCKVIDYQKLSIDACAHASQNERLPLRVVLQVLFFEQMHLRTALALCLPVVDAETAPSVANAISFPSNTANQIIERDGWVNIVRKNRVLKVDMEKVRSRVVELEQEFSKIKQEMEKVSKSRSSLSSHRLVVKKIGSKLLPRSSNAQRDNLDGPTLRASMELARNSDHSRQRKSFTLF